MSFDDVIFVWTCRKCFQMLPAVLSRSDRSDIIGSRCPCTIRHDAHILISLHYEPGRQDGVACETLCRGRLRSSNMHSRCEWRSRSDPMLPLVIVGKSSVAQSPTLSTIPPHNLLCTSNAPPKIPGKIPRVRGQQFRRPLQRFTPMLAPHISQTQPPREMHTLLQYSFSHLPPIEKLIPAQTIHLSAFFQRWQNVFDPAVRRDSGCEASRVVVSSCG